MNKVIITILSALFMMSTASISAQQEGTIVLEITEASGEGQAAQIAEMMKGTKTEVFFNKDNSLTKLNMMGGMVNINMLSKQGNGMDMLIDAMGQKIWVNQSQMDVDKTKMGAPEMDISYDEADRKEIAGFDCYKMIVSIDGDNGEQTIEAYITESLKIDAQVMQGVDMTKFKGFPLEYTFDAGVMSMTITTQEFKKTVDASVFDVNTSGYQKMTMDELKNMTGGMGFGF